MGQLKILVLCSSIFLIFPSVALSGELRDNRLPSERLSKPTASSSVGNTSSVYDQFRRDIKGFTPQQKQTLRKRFETQLQDPRLKEQPEQFQYYSTLLQILDEK